MTEPLYCEMYPTELATVTITYGLYSEYAKGRPHHVHLLCDKAALELWNECSMLVNLGEMHWHNKPVK